MRFGRFFLVLGMAILLFSCDLFMDEEQNIVYGGPGGGRENGKFYAQNMTNNKFYSLNADLLYEDANCKVWVEKNLGLTSVQALKAAEEAGKAYSKTGGIYEKMMAAFGSNDCMTDEGDPCDTMELADYYGDGDGKLCILLMKIKDSYHETKNPSYVAGYFTAYNYIEYESGYRDTWYSNENDMIYLDIRFYNQIKPEYLGDYMNSVYNTLAHEMQHLMNFITSVDKRSRANDLDQMDLWINEGLSSAAEFVWNGVHNKDRIDWFNGYYDEDEKMWYPNGWIAYGNNFYVWGNYTDQEPMLILDDYATVYLFFQWLRLQSNNDIGIYKEIINSKNADYRAVTAAAAKNISTDYNSNNWSLLLRDWLAANSTNATTGRYGYKNDSHLSLVDVWCLSDEAGNTYPLAPGEGIYTKKMSKPATNGNINYSMLPKKLSPDNPDASSEYRYLLSYNINTNMEDGFEYCDPFIGSYISQSPELRSYNTAAGSASRSLARFNPVMQKPYAISAGEMLRQNGYRDSSQYVDLTKFRAGVRIEK